MVQLSSLAGLETEIGTYADGKQAQVLPTVFGVVQDGGKLPDTDRRLEGSGFILSDSVLRQIEAQNLSVRKRFRQKADRRIHSAGLGPMDGDGHPF